MKIVSAHSRLQVYRTDVMCDGESEYSAVFRRGLCRLNAQWK